MTPLAPDQAQALAAIFAKVKCCDVLAIEVSWVWPEHQWKRLVYDEKRKLKEESEEPHVHSLGR